jgi:hypothetical protein
MQFTFRQYKTLRDLFLSYDAHRKGSDERDTGLDCVVWGFGAMPAAETVAELVNREFANEFVAEADMFDVIVRPRSDNTP